MLKMPRKMAVLGAMLAALLITGAALAQQTPPHTFYGFGDSVTIDGEDASSGTTIMAMAGGENVGDPATYSADAGWSIEVPADTMGVTFTVNGMAAEGSYDANPPGGRTMLTLAVTSATEESDELEDDAGGSGTTDGDGDVMDGGDTLEDDGDAMGEDGDVMDGGDGDSMQNEDGNGDGADDGSAGDGMTDGDAADATDDDADEGDADEGASAVTVVDSGDPPSGDEPTGTVDDGSAMGTDEDAGDDGSAMDDGEATEEGDNEFPDTGTGGLADSSRGVSSAVYGGIAGALALIALAGGVAVRRRAQS